MAHDTAGDPMTRLKWTRKTTEKIANELRALGISVSPNTVARLLNDLGFSLRVNRKMISGGSKDDRNDRNAQFEYIKQQREIFVNEGNPIISVDAKKKELVGNFKNPGTAWERESTPVHDHDFPSMADGKAVPYGVYDVQTNHGKVFVGISHDTPQFATECLEMWWLEDGRVRYPKVKKMLILADGGGSNGRSSRGWKLGIQENLCNRFGIDVAVCHYPPGTSKWNPIEHRLFSHISKNWAGRPLDGIETILNYISTTTTSTGLRVESRLVEKEYPTGVKISDDQMQKLALEPHCTLPKWNYTIHPQ